MKEEKYLEDLKEIRGIMDRSSRFHSLSGFSGVIIGLIATAGAYYAYQSLFADHNLLRLEPVSLQPNESTHLLLISVAVVLASAIVGIVFTAREAKRNKEEGWGFQSKRILINLLIPLVSGGIICLVLLQHGLIGYLPSFTLVFYGIALVNISKYTITSIRTLGIMEILLGLLCLAFVQYSLILWITGFGIFHIVHGIYMQTLKKS